MSPRRPRHRGLRITIDDPLSRGAAAGRAGLRPWSAVDSRSTADVRGCGRARNRQSRHKKGDLSHRISAQAFMCRLLSSGFWPSRASRQYRVRTRSCSAGYQPGSARRMSPHRRCPSRPADHDRSFPAAIRPSRTLRSEPALTLRLRQSDVAERLAADLDPRFDQPARELLDLLHRRLRQRD